MNRYIKALPKSITYLLISICAIAIAGCAVDKQKETSKYRDILKEHVPAQADMYKQGEPLSLDRALELANQTSDRLAIQGENYLQALIKKDRTVSMFLPTVSLAPSYKLQRQSHAQGVPAGLLSKFAPTQQLDVPIKGQLDINPLEDLQHSKQAGKSAKALKQALFVMQSQILLDTAKTYYQILRSKDQVRVLKKSLLVQNKRVQDIKSKYSVGAARLLDVAQSKAQQSDTKDKLIKAKNDVRNGRATLAMLIGAPMVTGKLSDTFKVPDKIKTQKQLMQIAYNNRYSLKEAKQNILAAKAGVQAAWSQYFPSITLNAAYFLHREEFPKDIDWMSSISVNLPLFSAGMIHQDVRASLSKMRQAKFSAKRKLKQVRKQVKQSRNNLDSNTKRIAELKVQVNAAKQAFNRASSAYDVGTATNLERLTAQQQLLDAKLKLTSQKFSHKILYLALKQATGKLTLATVKPIKPKVALSKK